VVGEGPSRPSRPPRNRFVEWYESAPFSPLILVILIGGAAAVAVTTEVPLPTVVLPVVFLAVIVFRVMVGARPAAPAAAVPIDDGWTAAHGRMRALRAEFAAYECDPLAVLRLPALADVTVPSTARFVDAFAEAQALETDTVPPAQHAAGFVAAVERAERAWVAAREAAVRIRDSNLSPVERAMVERVIKMLTVARESDSDAERRVAYVRARSELARLGSALRLPPAAQAAIDHAARGALPGGEAQP
jgi:hypothetical protein